MTHPILELARTELSFAERLEAIRRAKQEQTAEKQQVMGAMDYDDHALILPPPSTGSWCRASAARACPSPTC